MDFKGILADLFDLVENNIDRFLSSIRVFEPKPGFPTSKI